MNTVTDARVDETIAAIGRYIGDELLPFERGRFDGGYSNVSTLAGEVAAIKEAHHFYPMLFYFRFGDVFYALPRVLLVALDAAALIRTALDQREFAWLQESAALAEPEATSALLLRTLHESFRVEHQAAPQSAPPHDRWTVRYQRAFVRLRDGGIATRVDHDAGAREYVQLRGPWERDIEALAHSLRWRMDHVDRAARVGYQRQDGE